MKCPIDNIDLVMSDRQGIEIDYCPQCRGVWLDRGEIDKIVERSMGAAPAPAPMPAPRAPAPQQHYQQPPAYDGHRRDDDDDKHRYREQHGYHGGQQQKKHKESWLGDLFG
jgi:uncharacterized protein